MVSLPLNRYLTIPPLTREEIADLLYMAREAVKQSDRKIAGQTASSIQCRLIQGIVGIRCPHEIDGPVAQRQNTLDRLYMNYLSDELGVLTDAEIVENFYQIMQEGQ